MRGEKQTRSARTQDTRPREDKSTTRARILDACRVLFNERGPSEVTTAEIAQMVGISEGNLHYHFRRKQEIVTALFELFREELEKAPDGEAVIGPPGSRRRYLSHWFNLMWEWRFLHYANVYRLVPGLRPGLRDWANTMQAKVRVTLEALRRAGELEATDVDIDRLVVNAWIVGTYWIDYLRVHHTPEPITRDQLRWGFAQVEALFTPYMTGAPVGLREAG
jgi:AcrR family transcriptional regulator